MRFAPTLLAAPLLVLGMSCFDKPDGYVDDDDDSLVPGGGGAGGTNGTGGFDGADGSGGTFDGADGTDGQDGTSSDGSGGPSAGDPVSGSLSVYFEDGYLIDTWSIDGEVRSPCSSCEFSFEADFVASSSAFSRLVDFGTDGYVYTDAGEYWGYGLVYSSGAEWYTDYSGAPYYYSGAVSF